MKMDLKLLRSSEYCYKFYLFLGDCRGCDRMVGGFTTTHTKVVSLNLANSKVYSIQHYVIKFVSDLRQVSGFLWFPPQIKHCNNITEILLKVALNTITLTLPIYCIYTVRKFIIIIVISRTRYYI